MKLFTMGKLQVIVLLSVVMGITVSDAKYRSHQKNRNENESVKSSNAIVTSTALQSTIDDSDEATEIAAMTQAWPFNFVSASSRDDVTRRHDNGVSVDDSSLSLASSSPKPRQHSHKTQSDKLTRQNKHIRARNELKHERNRARDELKHDHNRARNELKHDHNRTRNEQTFGVKARNTLAREDSQADGGTIRIKKQRGKFATNNSKHHKKWHNRSKQFRKKRPKQAEAARSLVQSKHRYIRNRLSPELMRLRNSHMGSYDLDRLRYHIHQQRGWKGFKGAVEKRLSDSRRQQDDSEDLRAWKRFDGLRSKKGSRRWRSSHNTVV